jgi:hypothetical protein
MNHDHKPRGRSSALLAIAVVACAGLLALAGCGGDEDETATAETVTVASEETATQSVDGAALAAEDESAITETIRGWLTEGGCERMTDRFLEDQTFISDPAQACETFEASFSPPGYDADAILVSEITGDAAKAKATVGDEVSDIESIYTVVNDDGQWRIEAAGF